MRRGRSRSFRTSSSTPWTGSASAVSMAWAFAWSRATCRAIRSTGSRSSLPRAAAARGAPRDGLRPRAGGRVVGELIRVSVVGGIVAVDRVAGWSLMLSQPLVAACLAGALLNPGPEWELWALRIPIAVGAILQLLLTDTALPAAQSPRDTATAGVVGSAVALLGLPRLHPELAISAGGILWVVIGVAAGLVSAVLGGWFARLHQTGRATVARADHLAARGDFAGFDHLYWSGLLRTFLVGAAWAWGG